MDFPVSPINSCLRLCKKVKKRPSSYRYGIGVAAIVCPMACPLLEVSSFDGLFFSGFCSFAFPSHAELGFAPFVFAICCILHFFILAKPLNMSVTLSTGSIASPLAWFCEVSLLHNALHLRNGAITVNHRVFLAEGDWFLFRLVFSVSDLDVSVSGGEIGLVERDWMHIKQAVKLCAKHR